jgi:hypothetical protein
MRNVTIASVVLLGSVLAAACNESPVSTDTTLLAGNQPSLGLSAGETFSSILITNPTTTTFALAPGGSKQMSATLKYSLGGTLAGVPYATWRSSDDCIATVTSASPSWGLVRGVASGTALIIAEAWGKADTVQVTVSGTAPLSQACLDAAWSWDYTDESFTEAPLTGTQYKLAGPKAGEKLTQVVLFAPKDSVPVAGTVQIASELRYDLGGKLNAKGYVVFSVLDGAVAKVGLTGKVTALAPGRTKVIARLGEFADTVPVYVR